MVCKEGPSEACWNICAGTLQQQVTVYVEVISHVAVLKGHHWQVVAGIEQSV